MTERTLYNHLEKLKKLNIVKNIYPIWKLCQNQASSSKLAKLLSSDKIQAHKFSFILTLINKPHWWEKRKNKLMKLKEFHFKPVTWGNNPYEQLSRDNFLIQTFSNSIVILNQKEYFGRDAYECFIQSLEDTLEIYKFIEERFNFKFFNDGIPQLSVRTHHYVKLRDEIAKRCKKSGKMLQVEIMGKLRAWVDLSEPFGLETGHKNYAVEDNKRYANFVSDILEKDPPKNSEIAENLNHLTNIVNQIAENQKGIQHDQIGIQRNQVVFDMNMKSHTGAIQDVAKGVRNLDEGVTEFRNEIRNINFQQISPLDSIIPKIKSINDIILLKDKISKLSKEDKEKLNQWVHNAFGN